MAGVYIHIPFCRQKCRYCDFYSTASTALKDRMLAALLREMELQRDFLSGASVQTLYIGGGTPTVYAPQQLQQLIEQVKQVWNVHTFTELTVEANPDDLTESYLAELSLTAVDRLSIGLQSFHDRDLQLMNRRHDAALARQSVRKAQKHGFTNLSVDLIYGIPGSSIQDWKETLQQVLELQVPHISAYHLTVETGTVFGKWKEKGRLVPVEESLSEASYRLLEEILCGAGYVHYEVSNFALPGFEAVHNSNYWKQEPYLGIGPSAHSYNDRLRRWNLSGNRQYLAQLENGTFFESEVLSDTDLYNEYLMTRLRTREGIDLEEMKNRFGEKRYTHLLNRLSRWTESTRADGRPNLYPALERNGNRLFIPTGSFLLSDAVIADLFITE